MPVAALSPFKLERLPSLSVQLTGKYSSICASSISLDLGEGSFLPSLDAQYAAHWTPQVLSVYDLLSQVLVFTVVLNNAPTCLKWSVGGLLAVQISATELLLISNQTGNFNSQSLKRPFKVAGVHWANDVLAIRYGASFMLELWSPELKLLAAFTEPVSYPRITRDFDQYSVQVSRLVTDSQVHFLDAGKRAASMGLRNTRLLCTSACPTRVQAVCASAHSLYVVSPSAVLAQIRFVPTHIWRVEWLQCGEIAMSTVASVEIYDFELVRLATIGPTLRAKDVYSITTGKEDIMRMINPKHFTVVKPVVRDQPAGRFWAIQSSNFVAILSSMHEIKAIITWTTLKPVALLWSAVQDLLLVVLEHAIYRWNRYGVTILLKSESSIKGAMISGSTCLFWDKNKMHSCPLMHQVTLASDTKVEDTFAFLKRS